ncbi:MAG: fluoride efflux transporter CrcB [Phycisphaerales bacterium]|nr:fluoride efflux transporter CrcB [Phycisphaerales bacterium]
MKDAALIGAVALGGAVGAVLRYLVYAGTRRVHTIVGGVELPIATLAVNVVGSLAFGVLIATLPERPVLRGLLLVGLLGAFTTFSTFAFDTFAMFRDGRPGLAILNIVANNLICVLFAWAGFRAALALAPAAT